MKRIQRLLHVLLCVLFPERCIFCNEVIEPLQLCCEHCRQSISTVRPPICPFCGAAKKECSCGKNRHAYDRVMAPFYYEEAVRRGLLRLKRWDDPQAIDFFASQMAAVVRRECPELAFDGVCYIPMTKRDRRRREYNQSELLARELAKKLELPLLYSLVKIYETKPQKGLNRAQRSGNVLGAFDVKESLAGKKFLLVDDVVTTGATAHECAKMLKLYGADIVMMAAVAITAPKKEEKPAVKS